MYELISAFATQKFCSFWKTISPWILYTKSETFHHVLNSTSSLAAWSQFMSINMFLLYVKPYANEQKCKLWRQQRSPYVCAALKGMVFQPLVLKKVSNFWQRVKESTGLWENSTMTFEFFAIFDIFLPLACNNLFRSISRLCCGYHLTCGYNA